MKILVLVSNYGTTQRELCQLMINQFHTIKSHEFSIKVFSTEENRFTGCEEYFIHNYTGFDFSFGIYDFMKILNLDQWDYILMTENDLFYKEDNFNTVFKYAHKPFAISFLRYEEKDGARWLTDAQYYREKTSFEDRFGIVETIDNGSFIRFENCHQASWFLKTDLVKQLLKSIPIGKCLEGKMSNFYFSEKWPGTSGGIKKFVPIAEVDQLLVHHMPDKYVNYYVPSVNLNQFLTERDKKYSEVLV